MSDCEHVWIRRDDGVFCPDCGTVLEHAPLPWEPFYRAPALKDDIRPHFNFSAGKPVKSRAHLAEICKKDGLRPVDPDLRHESRAWEEVDRLKTNNEKKIRNPKRPLKHYYEEQLRDA